LSSVPAAPGSDALGSDAIAIRALPAAGPYPSLFAACEAAAPCGGTGFDRATEKITDPPAHPDCSAVGGAGPEYFEPNARSQGPELVHRVAGAELRIAPVACAVPRALHFDDARFYLFARRADGWWRSGPLFEVDTNNKYCGASAVVRWNAQPGRTFIGLAATSSCVACVKEGAEDETTEMMIRVETDGAAPVVFPPLVVGERDVLTPNADIDPQIDCKAKRTAISLAEHWPGPDDLVLTGPATWAAPLLEDGLLRLGFGRAGQPSPVGHYRFTR
jgi:hypothetical protein